jgi:hypothetical protein
MKSNKMIKKINRMKLTLVIITIFLLTSCEYQEKTSKEKKAFKSEENVYGADTIPSSTISFLDSVAKQVDLSVGQIKKYIAIDSIYYTGIYSNATFTGDTTWNLHSGVKAAIIEYSDGLVCSHKLIVIFSSDKGTSTDSKFISNDCDRDESANYETLEFKLITDSTFETTKTYIPSNSNNKKSVSIIQRTSWIISNRGKIDTLR